MVSRRLNGKEHRKNDYNNANNTFSFSDVEAQTKALISSNFAFFNTGKIRIWYIYTNNRYMVCKINKTILV